MLIRAYKHWLPVALWMGVIFIMSTDLGSGAHTSRLIEPLVRWIRPDTTPEEFERVHFLVRKSGHLAEYAVLTLLLLLTLKHSLPRPATTAKWSWPAAGLVLVTAAAYAATDEWHQSFVPGRTATLRDVLIDSGGALLALAVMFSWQKFSPIGLRPQPTAPVR